MPIVKYSARTGEWPGVEHDIGLDLAVWADVMPLLFGGDFLPHLDPGRHQRFTITTCHFRTAAPHAGRRRVRLQSPYGLLETHPWPPFEKSTENKIANRATTLKFTPLQFHRQIYADLDRHSQRTLP